MKNKSIGTGVAFIAIAVLFGLNALHYTLGTIDQPGPGFFPLTVSVFLFLLGVSVSIRGLAEAREPVPYKFKNILIISASLLGFAVATELVGMIAGIYILVFISSAAATTFKLFRAFMISNVLVIIAIAFKYLLGLNLPL
jgi:hypothetical protein